jgi:hypothetical protein
MNIYLSTYIDKTSLLKEVYSDYRRYYTSHLLLSVYIYPSGLVEVSPGLSKLLLEPNISLSRDLGVQYSSTNTSSTNSTSGSNSNIVTMNLFLDDYTIKAGQQVGFAVSTYRYKCVHTNNEYEYSIYNSKEVLNPISVESYIQRQKVIDSIYRKENIYMDPTVWRQDSTSSNAIATTTSTVSIYVWQLELVETYGFESDGLFIVYNIDLPNVYKLRTGTAITSDSGNNDGKLCI